MSRAKAIEMIRTLMIALVISAGCGGNKAAPHPRGGPAEGGTGGGGQAGMSPEVTRFHDVLRPLWHADKGPARMKNTCAAMESFKAESDAIAKATPPESTNADTSTAGTRSLVSAVTDLSSACAGTDEAAFEAAFGKVHDAFHALMGAGNTGEHGEHGEHHEHGGH